LDISTVLGVTTQQFVLALFSLGARLGEVVEFYAEFHSSNDRRFWTNPTNDRLFSLADILSRPPADSNELCDAMRERGFWPLYLDGNIHQFNVAFKPISRWVSIELFEKERGRHPDGGPKLVLRRPTRNTDERTVIAAVLPPRSAFADLLTGVRCGTEMVLRMQGLLNSITFDFQLRRRVSGRDLRPYHLKPCVIPPIERLASLPAFESLHIEGQTIWHNTERWGALWLTEKGVAESYGITPWQFEDYLLCSFPVFARKRPAFFAYLNEQLAKWKEEIRGN
jgi:hypothetical protein